MPLGGHRVAVPSHPDSRRGEQFNEAEDLRETLRGKTLPRVATESARLRPDPIRLADPTQATKHALRSIAARIAAVNSEAATLDKELHQLVTRAAPHTLSLLGVGPDHAAQLLITAG